MYPSVPEYLFGKVLRLKKGDRVTIDYDLVEDETVKGTVRIKNRFGVLVVPYQHPKSVRERLANLVRWTFVQYNQMESINVLEDASARGSNIAAVI